MKLVINRCFGGFGLSQAAYEKLIEWGIPVKAYDSSKNDYNDGDVIFDNSLVGQKHRVLSDRYWECWTRDDAKRSHPLVVRVVEELGEEASSTLAKLEVVEIPDDIAWEIDDYDGNERIDECHRSW